MMATKQLPDPFDIVAKALGCVRSSLSIDSGMYRDHGWDSFGHIKVILALENAYGIRVDDDAIERYVTMKTILELYETAQRGDGLHDG